MTRMAPIIDHKRQYRVIVPKDMLKSLDRDHVINFCEDCRAYHIDPRIGPETDGETWKHLELMIEARQ